MSFMESFIGKMNSATQTLKTINNAMEGSSARNQRQQGEWETEQLAKRQRARTSAQEHLSRAKANKNVVLPGAMTRQLLTVITATHVALDEGNFSFTQGGMNVSSIVALMKLIERLRVVSSQLDNHCQGVRSDSARWANHAKDLGQMEAAVARSKSTIAFHERGFERNSGVSLMTLDYL